MMSLHGSILVAVAIALAAPATATTGVDPGVDEPISPSGGHELWLSGPFGRVSGGSIDAPATAQPPGAALDTFSRNARLSLDAGPASILVERLEVRSTSPGRPDMDDEVLSTGHMDFAGPSTTGTSVLVVELIARDQQRTVRAWLLEVPDRDAPPDGLYDIPAPDVLVAAGSETVAGSPGNGCYIDLCVEIGAPAPIATLPEVPVSREGPFVARLADGSGVVAWEGSIEPLPGTPGTPASTQGAIADGAAASVDLAALVPPTRGTWLLTLKVVFDRERGWLTTTYRLAAD